MSRKTENYLSSYYIDLDISKKINDREKKMKVNGEVNGARGRGSQW